MTPLFLLDENACLHQIFPTSSARRGYRLIVESFLLALLTLSTEGHFVRMFLPEYEGIYALQDTLTF